jgi:hypothetical protein
MGHRQIEIVSRSPSACSSPNRRGAASLSSNGSTVGGGQIRLIVRVDSHGDESSERFEDRLK